MIIKTVLLSLCLLCSEVGALAQRRKPDKPLRVSTVALHHVGEYPNRYVPGTFMIPNIVLEDVRSIENTWNYVLQLYDPKTKVRRGQEVDGAPFDTYDFLICTGPDIGNSLIERRDMWLNRRVNVYFIKQDVGLTVFVYAGLVKKIELLDEKGKVIGTFY